MILFLLNNWKWLAGALASVVLGVLLGIAKIEISDLKAAAAKTALAIQVQKTEAQKILADAQEHARDVEAQNAALNIQLEKDHAAAQQQIDKDADDLHKLAGRVGQLLHEATRRGSCGPDHMPSEGNPTSGGPSSAASDGLSDALAVVIAEAGDLFKEADGVADVGIQCHNFATGSK